MKEAISLFKVSTMDAARSGITQHLNPPPELANEIKVSQKPDHRLLVYYLIMSFRSLLMFFWFALEQQAEAQIKRRIGIGSHISERRLIDDLARMGMNESIVRIREPTQSVYFPVPFLQSHFLGEPLMNLFLTNDLYVHLQ